MPLSEHEQRLLDEMERNLYQNDADFVAAVSKGRGGTNYRAVLLGIFLAIFGLAALVAGVVLRQPLVGIGGFVVMLGGVVVAMRPAIRTAGEPGFADIGHSGKSRSTSPHQSSRFIDRLNERWDRRDSGRS
ncbi:DUF3040 domain-containing protein [Rathayibacter toxicus]|uniref:DUF3040 domain-containing protein n=1 Tax=Rathayibacter toxicus TaxID=145458 RepID=A0A0C5BDZ2_9MICO|nr:DUF3040 domain-containing protein [Rathayibacter toxicus]AJM77471.1 membrane protein [Rathayibacter toxicus]ALS56623.1 hypothetical protein APU90_01520 [Rathayibacter toxicus]KKM44714.1 membrane protein [Rathayibacter toxicus]PPG21547.1 DUF3040 domain-containing protein [Rathayibacter toxicus]PPG46511.1 DUF3040 domain-containing protein [Rathayibacter toxicus]